MIAGRWVAHGTNLSAVTGDPVSPEAFFQQLNQGRGRIHLPFDRDVSGDRVSRALDQNAENCIRVRVGLADHADHLSEDMERVWSIGCNALHTADQFVHGSEWSVLHNARMANRAAMLQPSELGGDDGDRERLNAGGMVIRGRVHEQTH
jgi:hypothetical protein